MEFFIEPYKVYVKTNDSGCIIAGNSSAFLSDVTGWEEIDSGYDYRCHHAQSNYFEKPLMDERGICRYKLIDGQPVERTALEMDADCVESAVVPTQLDLIEAQVTYTAMMTDTLLEE